eukprot:8799366-Prorocentrum_lima.AAC.1
MPTKDLSRMSLAQELQARIARVPITMSGLANWLEDYVAKLEVWYQDGMSTGTHNHPYNGQ